MKKLLICLVILATLISACISAAADGETVEISFCVGDDTLIINGNPVKVEKPYVVESAGVTLVPVRVITEAFDAKVDWVDETQTVILTYPDVNITIQIGNPIAEVNGRAVELLTPPELTESGYTMVPLRFISENFGADVFYDEATERITVIKQKSENSEVSIEGAVSSKYIGDSHYKWQMENPKDMTMDYRDFDGMDTIFSDGTNKINIEVFIYDKEEYNFENDYNEIKMSMSNLTLVKNEKDASDKDCMKLRLSAKNTDNYVDYIQFVTPDYIYSVTGIFSNEDTKVREAYIALLSTFECKFEQTDMHDLSNIKDGFKRFESEQMKLSFDVPESFCMASSEDSHNSFSFYELKADVLSSVSCIKAQIYSKSDVESARALAVSDFEHNRSLLNEDLVKFDGAPAARQYANISATEYSYTIESSNENSYNRDIFFELGDYVYNFSISVELPNDDCDGYVNRLVESIKAEPLDSEEIGILMRNIPEATGTVKVTIGNATIELPNNYTKVIAEESTIGYIGSINGVVISCIKVAASGVTTNDLKQLMKDAEQQKLLEGAESLRSVYEKHVINQRFICFRVIKDGTIYEQFACVNNNFAYIFTTSCSELSYSKSTRDEISAIIDSIKFK